MRLRQLGRRLWRPWRACSIWPKLDAEKRNILDIADIYLRILLHNTAHCHPDPAATKLLIRHNPSSLLAKETGGDECYERRQSPTRVNNVTEPV